MTWKMCNYRLLVLEHCSIVFAVNENGKKQIKKTKTNEHVALCPRFYVTLLYVWHEVVSFLLWVQIDGNHLKQSISMPRILRNSLPPPSPPDLRTTNRSKRRKIAGAMATINWNRLIRASFQCWFSGSLKSKQLAPAGRRCHGDGTDVTVNSPNQSISNNFLRCRKRRSSLGNNSATTVTTGANDNKTNTSNSMNVINT